MFRGPWSRTFLFSSIAAFLLLACGGAPTPTPLGTTVRIAAGEIEGERLAGDPDGHGAVLVFRGVPYARPPVGELRWRPPEPAEPWDGVRPAVELGPACVQPELGGFYGREEYPESEDCLTLNLWTAATTASERRPVMVWIHGGGFVAGTSRSDVYDGTHLAREGAVVVTFNYRLNVFGFLAHPALTAESEHGSSGYYGLLDQIAVLRWVKDNVAAFGGDPERVTIFGESAGSISVNLLTASPLARGLFHRAIGESGGVMPALVNLSGESVRGGPSAEEIGELFAEALGVEAGDEAAAAMRSKTADEVFEAFASDPRFMSMPNFLPVDGWVIPSQPMEIFDRGEQADVPVLVGTNADEGSALVDYFPEAWYASKSGFEEYARATFGDSAEAVLALYPVAADEEARDALAELFGDDLFTYPVRTWARGMENVASPAYLYHFTAVPQIEGFPGLGSYHAAEIPYVFGTRWPDAVWREPDERLSRAMRGAWMRFAATGDPNGGDLPEWPAFTPANEAYLEFGDEVRVGERLEMERVKALDDHYRGIMP